MRTVSIAQRVLATSLAIVFASCSATRPSVAGPTGSRDLARYVLVVDETTDGQASHTWKSVENVDLKNFHYNPSAMRAHRSIVRVSTSLRSYCAGRREQCETDCLASSRPIPVGHLQYPTYRGPWRVNKGWWCQEACMKLEDMCNRGMGEWSEDYAAEFDAIDPAVDWIKKHRQQLLAGTVIVIAGVAFMVAVAASAGGALILVPVVLLVEDASGAGPTTRFAENVP